MMRLVLALVLSFAPCLAGLGLGLFGSMEGCMAATVRERAEIISCAELLNGRVPTQANIVLTGYQVRWSGVTILEMQENDHFSYDTLIPLGPATKRANSEPKAEACCVLVRQSGRLSQEEIEQWLGQDQLACLVTNRGGFWQEVATKFLLLRNLGLDPAHCWELTPGRTTIPFDRALLMIIGGVACMTIAFVTAFAFRGYPDRSGSGFDVLLGMMAMLPALGVTCGFARVFHILRARAPTTAAVFLLIMGVAFLGLAWGQWQKAGPPVPGGSTVPYVIPFLGILFGTPFTLLGLVYLLWMPRPAAPAAAVEPTTMPA